MAESFKIMPADPYPLGISYDDGKIRVSAVFGNCSRRGIILSEDEGQVAADKRQMASDDSQVAADDSQVAADKRQVAAGKRQTSEDERQTVIEIDERYRHGSVYSCYIIFDKTEIIGRLSYRLFEDGHEFIDGCACGVNEHICWMQDRSSISFHGRIKKRISEISKEPRIPFSDSLFYMLSVRSFTQHSSSGVKGRGTFEGLAEKKDYIKSLGVTSLILMPCYEFYERMDDGTRKNDSMDYAVRHYKDKPGTATDVRCNLWGYTGNAFYYMPKSSFSFSGDQIDSFSKMVDAFHEDNIEIIMQFYFEPGTSTREILSVLEFWTLDYRIDGFQLVGSGIPVAEIERDPILSDRKLLFDRYMLSGDNSLSDDNAAGLDDDFANDMRHFLKGDSYSIRNTIMHIRAGEDQGAHIHYIARQEGMRLYDIVTYNEKHNEHNGEDNCDGRPDDFSWNCGIEGATRRSSINNLRTRQIKNGISMVFMTQGIPLIYSGDEFGNTQYGNNNPYCQDNAEGYVKWNTSKQSREILEWTNKMIKLRERYRILHMSAPFKGTDYLSCAYPDISLHGADAWRIDENPGSHLISVMYCMRYGCENDTGLIYVAYNMHWEPQKISFPKPFKGQEWRLYACSTDKADKLIDDKGKNAIIPSRSTAIFISKMILHEDNNE